MFAMFFLLLLHQGLAGERILWSKLFSIRTLKTSFHWFPASNVADEKSNAFLSLITQKIIFFFFSCIESLQEFLIFPGALKSHRYVSRYGQKLVLRHFDRDICSFLPSLLGFERRSSVLVSETHIAIREEINHNMIFSYLTN